MGLVSGARKDAETSSTPPPQVHVIFLYNISNYRGPVEAGVQRAAVEGERAQGTDGDFQAAGGMCLDALSPSQKRVSGEGNRDRLQISI